MSGNVPSLRCAGDVLIIGAGVVGLTLAQGCREAGIPFKIFEKLEASSESSQGWGLTLHWSLTALERTIGPRLAALLSEVGAIHQHSVFQAYPYLRPMSTQLSKEKKLVSYFSMLRLASSNTTSIRRTDF